MNVKILIADLDVMGGTHKQVVKLAKYLIEKGHDVEVLTNIYKPSLTYSEFSRMRVKVIYPASYEKLSRIRKKIARLFYGMTTAFGLARSKAVINIHDYGFELITLCARLISMKLIMVWQINDLPGHFCVGANKERKKERFDFLNKLKSILVAKCVDLITVNVSKNAERVRQYLKSNAEVVYPGVELPKEEIKTQARNKNDGFLRPIRLLSIGVLLNYRNYESIIYSQAQLSKKNGVRSVCNVIGRTSHNEAYCKKLISLAKANRVDFNMLGQVSDEQLNAEFELAPIFLFINVDQSWGLAVFEAMGRGIPCIVSNSVGATELLIDKQGVIIVNPTNTDEICNAIMQLSNENYYANQSRIAKEQVRSMSWEEMYCRPIEERFSQLTDKT